MANAYYKLAMVGIIGFISFGAFMAYYGYQNDVYPLDQARGLLDRIKSTENTEGVIENIQTIKTLLPEQGNPVWIFPTETTDFGKIQEDLDNMIASVEIISTVPQDSSAYHTGMTNVHERAKELRLQLLDATPYMYVSFSNIVLSSLWIATILGIFAMLKRKKQRLQSYEMSDEV